MKCQNCNNEFIIDSQDTAFYNKMSVPVPTFCPDCRLQRRLAFFNMNNLYKRKCDLCKKDTISMYAPEMDYIVYCPHCWWGDDWDALEYGRDYDFNKPFFEQFNELWHETPMLGLSIDLQAAINSPYNNHAGHLKNCYLLFHTDFTEDSAYGVDVFKNKSVFDCSVIDSSELCYDSIHTYRCNRGIGLNHVDDSLDCMFLRDSRNCQNCFACANLHNKQYYVFNKPYSKEGYFKEIAKYDLGSYKTYMEVREMVEEHWKKFVPQPQWDKFSTNCTGNYVFESKNCKQCYDVKGAQDCKYIFTVEAPIKDCYDISSWGNNQTLCYEGSVLGEETSNVKFAQEAGLNLHDSEYCKLSTSASYHFGCVSVKKAKYCILNKQYTKEEYMSMLPKIRKHMNDMPYTDKQGRVYKYGEFFPIDLSSFYYNHTIAYKFFPLTKEQCLEHGYKYRDEEEKEYTVTMEEKDLPEHIKDVKDSILNQVISCKKCFKGFKIIAMELNFLRNRNLPLPRECPFCRIEDKFNQWIKNLRIVSRQCSQCKAMFETSYTEQDVKHILCKKCYLQQVV